MNFFERQKKAKRKIELLILLFLISIFGVCFGISYTIGVLFINSRGDKLILSPVSIYQNMSPELLLYTFFGTFAVIIAGSLYKISQLSDNSGVFIAKSLNGKLLTKRATNANELMLLNIVDEMSIASGIPSPPVYLMDKDNTINAFAAGTTYDDAIIGVTKGAVELLTREELQGVIAHEFSHIFNGDMKLNIRSIGILHGILCISLVGEFIVRSARHSRKNGGGAILIGITLYVAGYIGLFFGSLIKAAINRQREYLADASATQFTRYPKGLAGALKKIGGAGSVINSAKADEFSHLYFSSGVKNFFSFNTHPPLEKRILALEPLWNGKFIFPKPLKTEIKPKKISDKKESLKAVTVAAILNEIDNAGSLNVKNLQRAKNKIAEIPQTIYNATTDTIKSQLIIFALLLDKNETVRKIQRDIIKTEFLETENINFKEIEDEIPKLQKDLILNVIQINMPTLKTLTKEQYLKFRTVVNRLIEADKALSYFEINLKYIVLYPLDITFGLQKIPHEIYSNLFSINFEVSAFLSVIAYSQFNDNEKALEVFSNMTHIADEPKLSYMLFENISLPLLESAYIKMQKCKPLLRRKIIEMTLYLLKSDGKFTAKDLESIHALSSLLHLPVSID
ncbi:MAG: M48 family metallopeptidase [Campylobacteraceae bacterium]|jgi:Zn-dependent protease with chaperone function|nr:M48 family metallopeptidase [Campylobacteraceae bacterium]